jgi:uncharacterized protein with PIN domain
VGTVRRYQVWASPLRSFRAARTGLRQQGRRFAPVFVPRPEGRGYLRCPACAGPISAVRLAPDLSPLSGLRRGYLRCPACAGAISAVRLAPGLSPLSGLRRGFLRCPACGGHFSTVRLAPDLSPLSGLRRGFLRCPACAGPISAVRLAPGLSRLSGLRRTFLHCPACAGALLVEWFPGRRERFPYTKRRLHCSCGHCVMPGNRQESCAAGPGESPGFQAGGNDAPTGAFLAAAGPRRRCAAPQPSR